MKFCLLFCIICEQFPCKIINKKLINSHLDNPKFKYPHEIPIVFAKLKSMSLNEYHKFQTLKWKCKSCNGTVYFYKYKCNSCRKEQMIN